jgi:hypothetical protein
MNTLPPQTTVDTHLPATAARVEASPTNIVATEGTGEIMADPKSHWNSLEVVKVLIAATVPISIFIAGAAIANSTKRQEEVRSKWEAIGQLSHSALERRSRSELLGSAVRRQVKAPHDAGLAEVLSRKRAYDESYVEWNANVGKHMLALRRATSDTEYTRLESNLQRSLVNAAFRPLDACLTSAFDEVVRGNNNQAVALMDACDTRKLIQEVLDCSYEITNEAYAVAAEVKTVQQASSGRCPAPVN